MDNSQFTADHHYVPKFYLKGFTDKRGALWVYEHGVNAPRQSKPKHQGHRANYYTFDDRGQPDASTEKVLSRAESVVAHTFRKLANPQFTMTEKERSELYSFVALMFVRVPAYREYIDNLASRMMKAHSQSIARDRDKFYAMIRQYEAETGHSLGDPEELRKFAAGNDYTVTQRSAGFNILLALQSFLDLAAILEAEYRHDVLYAPKDSNFVACDNPVICIEPGTDGKAWVGMGIGRPRTEVILPLNKRACLILRRSAKGQRVLATESFTEQINNMTMRAAQKYIYASRGYRRLARIFNERGCKIKYGENAFLAEPRDVLRR
jgi:hypothetical protein